jgi:hypothetical protein
MKVPTGLVTEATSVKDWGSRLANMTNKLRVRHPDATVIEFSTYKLFESILNNTKAYKQTAGLTVMDTFCDGYSKFVSPKPFVDIKSDLDANLFAAGRQTELP